MLVPNDQILMVYKISWQSQKNWLSGYRKANFYFGPSFTVGQTVDFVISGPVFSYKLRYIGGFGLVEMVISTNPKPTIYRNLYDNKGWTCSVSTKRQTRQTSLEVLFDFFQFDP